MSAENTLIKRFRLLNILCLMDKGPAILKEDHSLSLPLNVEQKGISINLIAALDQLAGKDGKVQLHPLRRTNLDGIPPT